MTIACYIPSNDVFNRLESALIGAGFDCERLPSDISFSRIIRRRNYDFIVIDIGTKEQERDGIFSWMSCRLGDGAPVLVLSQTNNAELVAHALDAGADDFLPTRFEPVELVARIRAVSRRTTRRPTRRVIELVGFSMDRETQIVSYQGVPIALTPREFTMAWLFFSTPGIYISRETISSSIWGVDSEIAGRTIEQHVYKLRKKLQIGIERGVLLRTAYNQGYRLELCHGDTANL